MHSDERPAGAFKSIAEALSGPGRSAGKLAILRQILAETCQGLAHSFRPAGDVKFELTLKSLDFGQAGDVLSGHSESIVTAALRAEQWETSLLAGIDRDFIHSLTDVLFGGSGGATPFRPERNLTRIELDIAKAVFNRMAAVLGQSCTETGPSSFALEHTDSPPSFEVVGRPSSMIAVATIDLGSVCGSGRMFIAFPQSIFVFLRAAPARSQASPPRTIDPHWQQLLGNRLYSADVTVTAVLGARQMTLGEISSFRPGQIIEMDSLAGHRISLDCNGQTLFWCKLAQVNGAYSVNIEGAVDPQQEFMDDILSH